ncbi:hypothetical protein SAMN05518865_105167 [Duganella sp. CF458]|uniref:hypothetical protein n=1 Tax=Duganella sp. CF458 TaxID=1884368 RepID=UPI0008E7C736|nr:hypothetical protein [Duganella sp. CF458]SFF85062.1 hypothetical protein SAMN05518865_105167 [Duganella sp. CF458]
MKLFKTTLLLSALAASFSASAAERLYLQTPVQIAPGSFVPQAVRNECELESHLVEDASAKITKEYGRVELATANDDVGNDKVVKITITNAWGAGGGKWSGPKSLEVLAELKQSGATLSSATFRRTTNVGLFRGTCEMFHKVTRELGEDVADWLNEGAPSKPVKGEDARKPAE